MSSDCCAVLVNYRCAHDLAGAVRSLKAQSEIGRVVVVDNSEDAEEFERLQALVGTSADLLRAPTNIGFGRACNWAFEATHEPYVLLANPDVRFQPGAVGHLLQAVRRDPRVGAVAPRQYFDDALEWLLPPAWAPTAMGAWVYARALSDVGARRRLTRALQREALRYWSADVTLPQRALSGGALLVRRSALANGTPLFDPRFFMYFEDSDLCRRLRSTGWTLQLVPDALAVHAWNDAPHKARQMAEASQQFFEKHWPSPNRWRQLTQRLIEQPPLPDPQLRPVDETSLPINEAAWLELSPNAMFFPAIGRKVEDPVRFSWVQCPWTRFGPGQPVYARCSLVANGAEMFQAVRVEAEGRAEWRAN